MGCPLGPASAPALSDAVVPTVLLVPLRGTAAAHKWKLPSESLASGPAGAWMQGLGGGRGPAPAQASLGCAPCFFSVDLCAGPGKRGSFAGTTQEAAGTPHFPEAALHLRRECSRAQCSPLLVAGPKGMPHTLWHLGLGEHCSKTG